MSKILKLSEIKNMQDVLQTIDNNNYQIIEIKNFLSNDECDNLVKYADTQYYQKSLTSEGASTHRKSNQIWIYDSENDVASKISDLTNKLTGSPIDHFEPLQLLRYGKGEYFYEHYDATLTGYDRIYTILIYLNNGYKGGITHFNNLNISIKPEKGKAVLFKSLANDKIIEKSLHQGCEVYDGMKYVCNKWVHIGKYT
jgi:prolyl 4-hydroxylase